MKYKLKKPPKVNDVRSVKKYAWLPAIAYSPINEDKYLIWLEKYLQNQKYVIGLTFHGWIKIKNYI